MDRKLSHNRKMGKLCCAFGVALHLQNLYAQQPAIHADTTQADWSLSFGGEVRERFEYYSNPNFSLQGQQANGYLLHRVLLHADVHAGDYVRAFVELGNHLAPWKDSAAPPYLNRLDPHQAFLDVRLPLTSTSELDPVLRIGRQEMAFGSQRLVAIRDAPNVRRNFDGIRLGGTVESARVDAFVTRPVQLRKGAFDDGLGHSQEFWASTRRQLSPPRPAPI